MSSALAVAACKDGQEVCAKKRKKFDHAPRPSLKEERMIKLKGEKEESKAKGADSKKEKKASQADREDRQNNRTTTTTTTCCSYHMTRDAEAIVSTGSSMYRR